MNKELKIISEQRIPPNIVSSKTQCGLLIEIRIKETKYFAMSKRHTKDWTRRNGGRKERERDRGRDRDRDVGGEEYISVGEWTGYSLAECTIKARERGIWRFITAKFRSEEKADDDDDEYTNIVCSIYYNFRLGHTFLFRYRVWH